MSTNRGRVLRSDDEIDELLARTRSVAVVGLSADSKRPSRRVAAYLIGGFFLITYSGDNQRTASNAPAVERSAPAPTPAPPATSPAKQQ